LSVIKNNPLVSIVVALYNSERYIEETIDSVLRQSYDNFELIIVDDNSTDCSALIVDRFIKLDSRVRLISLKKNSGGPAKPRNIGINESKGEFIAFLDSDDVWKENKLSIQISKMSTTDVMSFTGVDIIDADGVNKARFFYDWLRMMVVEKIAAKGLRGILVLNPVPLSTVLLRAKHIKSFRFDEDVYMHAIEDYGMWLMIYKCFPDKILYIKEKLVNYRRHSDGISSCYVKEHIKSVYCVTKFYLFTDKYEYLVWFLLGQFIRTFKVVIGRIRN